MASPADQISYQAGALHDLVAGVQADQWANPTPCAKWSVRDLVNHLVGGGTIFAASFRGESVEMESATPDMLGDDATSAWDGVIASFETAVSAPGAMDREVVLPFATLPAQVALDIASFDLLVHAWDLARATGQSFDPPDNDNELLIHSLRPQIEGGRPCLRWTTATWRRWPIVVVGGPS